MSSAVSLMTASYYLRDCSSMVMKEKEFCWLLDMSVVELSINGLVVVDWQG